MLVLLTGAFGNLGTQALVALLRRGDHRIRCCDVESKKARHKRQQLARLGAFETVWADITNPDALEPAVANAECVLHFAGVIPPQSEEKPTLTERVNVTGTRNLIAAAEQQPAPPKVVFASSFTVHGNKRLCPPPRHAGEKPEPMDHYTRSKVACEEALKASGVPWTILRIAAAIPLDLLEWDMASSMAALFDVPLAQRIEFVHPHDFATAFLNAIDAETAGKILYVGGGESFQMLFGDYVQNIFEILGLDSPPATAFRTPREDSEFWYTDYVDTREGQALLDYQNNTFSEYLAETKRKFGWRRPLVRLLRPLVMRFILRYSPYLHNHA